MKKKTGCVLLLETRKGHLRPALFVRFFFVPFREAATPHPHARQDWYPGVAGSLFSAHLCRLQNDRFRPGRCFLMLMERSPYLTHRTLPSRPRTSFADFLLPGVHWRGIARFIFKLLPLFFFQGESRWITFDVRL